MSNKYDHGFASNQIKKASSVPSPTRSSSPNGSTSRSPSPAPPTQSHRQQGPLNGCLLLLNVAAGNDHGIIFSYLTKGAIFSSGDNTSNSTNSTLHGKWTLISKI